MDAEQLEHLERARLRSLITCDRAAAADLHADDYQLITPGGHALSKDAYLDFVCSGDFTYDVFEPADTVAVRIHDSVAIARYLARIEVHDGTGATEAGNYWHTDIWERRDDRWQAVWSQATRVRESEPED